MLSHYDAHSMDMVESEPRPIVSSLPGKSVWLQNRDLTNCQKFTFIILQALLHILSKTVQWVLLAAYSPMEVSEIVAILPPKLVCNAYLLYTNEQ